MVVLLIILFLWLIYRSYITIILYPKEILFTTIPFLSFVLLFMFLPILTIVVTLLLVLLIFILLILNYKEQQRLYYDKMVKEIKEYLDLCKNNLVGFYEINSDYDTKCKTREIYIKNNGTCNILYDDAYIRSDLNYKVEDDYFIINFEDGGVRRFRIYNHKGKWSIVDNKCILRKINYNESKMLEVVGLDKKMI